MSEPNQDIEKKLKRYAEQRRKDAGGEFELHPATRNLLQGEVARTFAAEKTRRTGFLANLLWPRLAIAAAFSAILAVTILFLNTPKKRPLALAKSQRPETVTPANRSISHSKETFADTKPARKINSAPAADRLAHEVAAPQERVDSAIPAAAPTALQSDVQTTPDLRKQENAPARQEPLGVLHKTAPSAAVETKASANAPSYFARDFTHAAESNRLFFQENLRAKYRRNLLSPAQPDVLKSFEWIRNGNQIRLLDSDGSVYLGEILAPQSRASGTEPPAANSEFAFRVKGTNQHLNSVLTFTGKFSETNAAKRPGLITGNVSIGATNEFPIRAIERSE